MPRTKSFDEGEILADICTFFWKRGYNSTSMDQIGAHVSLTKTSLYNAYGNKASLFRKSLEWYMADVMENMGMILIGEESVSKEISSLFEYYLVQPKKEVISRGCIITNSILELSHVEPELYDYVCAQFQRVPGAFKTYLDTALRQGRLKANTNTADLTEYVMTILQGFRVQTRMRSDSKQTQKVIEIALTAIEGFEPTNEKMIARKIAA